MQAKVRIVYFDFPKFIYDEPTLDTIDIYMSSWCKDDPKHRKRAFKAAYRAWLRTRAGEAQNWRCCWCKKKVPDSKVTLEHVTPITLGGKDEWENAAMACKSCNTKRGHHESPEAAKEYAASISKPKGMTMKQYKRRIYQEKKAMRKAQNWADNGQWPIAVEHWVKTLRAVSQVVRDHIVYQYG